MLQHDLELTRPLQLTSKFASVKLSDAAHLPFSGKRLQEVLELTLHVVVA